MVNSSWTMAARNASTQIGTSTASSLVENDPRLHRLLGQLKRDPKLAPIVVGYEKDAAAAGRKFGKNGLKTKAGKLFVLFTQDTLVVKLPKERVAALVDDGIGKPFDPGHGRLMKEWLTVTSPKASWVGLAKEAFEFVERVR
jgi:hypothetical protein